MNQLKKYGPLVVAGTALGSALPVHAAIDVSDVVTSISTDGVAAATAVGAAILTFLGVVLLYKLIRRVF